ncbi:MAG TPA: hypothetical protein PLF22_01985 [Pseudomonadales bacterium]|nr:hypothetical protein [Pseudomonadales bacterium]
MLTAEKPQRVGIYFLLPLLAAACCVGLLLLVVVSRWDYPYELEWIEGSVLQHVVRVLQGKPVYVLPDMEYAPALYTPGYYYAAAVFARCLGAGLPALRALSFSASLLSAVFIAGSVWTLTASRLATLLAGLMWASVFRFTGFWFDIARVDSFWVCCLMGSLFCLLRCWRQPAVLLHVLLAAVCLALSVTVKQSSLILLPFLAAAVFCWAGLRMATVFSAVVLLLLACFVGYMQYQSGGLFWFYTMAMAPHHGTTKGFPGHFFYGDLLFAIPVFIYLNIYFLLRSWVDAGKQKTVGLLAVFSGFFWMSFSSRYYIGGYLNGVMPLDFVVVLLAASGFFVFISHVPSVWKKSLLTFWLVVNLVFSWYVPAAKIPTAADRAYGDALVARIKAVSGRVCLTRHSYLAFLAGKDFCAHETQLTDIVSSENADMKARIFADVRQKISQGFYQVLVIDSMPELSAYVSFDTIPYVASDLDVDKRSPVFYPVVNGPRPRVWLEYKQQPLQ